MDTPFGPPPSPDVPPDLLGGLDAPPPPEAMDEPAPQAEYGNAENLVTKLPPEYLEAVANRVVSDKDLDWGSGEGYRAKRDRQVRLFSGDMPNSVPGQDNITLVHMPYTTKAVLMFHAKVNKSLFPATGDICGMAATRPESLDRARKVSKHMNQYLRKRIPEYIPAHDRNGIRFLIYGSAFTTMWYDAAEKRIRFESLNSDQVIIPYKFQSDFADMRDVPRITWRKEMYRHEVEAQVDAGYYDKAAFAKMYPKELGKAGAPDDSAERPLETGRISETADHLQGVKRAMDDGDPPRDILEQDRWLKLPGQDRQRPITVCVDSVTKAVLRLALREREDARDKRRHQNEGQAFDAHVQAVDASHGAAVDAAHQQAAAEHGAALQMGLADPTHPPPPPQLPEHPGYTMQPPAPVRTRPFCRHIHTGCIPNPEGFYHYGIGYLAEGHNIVADEVMSRYVSLLTMHLSPTFFYSRQSKMERGAMKLKLGEGNELPLPVEQINAGAGIFQFQFPSPDSNVFKLEERQAQAVQELTADDVANGAAGMSGQTAAETEIRSANAMDNISTVAARYNRGRTAEIEVIAYILSQTLDEAGDEFYEASPDGQTMEQFVVRAEDYADDFDVTFTADPHLASQPQREAKAMKLMSTILQLPPGTLDPPTTVTLIRAGAVGVFEAMDRDDFAAIIKNAAPPPPPMPQIPPSGGSPQPGGESNGPGQAAVAQPPGNAEASPEPQAAPQ